MPAARRTASVLSVLALAAGALATATPSSAQAGPPVAVVLGGTPETTVFPNDWFTVPDPAQLTGRRVALPVPSCTPATRSPCDAVAGLNTLDGFDLQPRFFLPFTGAIDVGTVTPASVYVDGPGGRVGLQELTFDPAANVLAGTPRAQLRESTTYALVVTRQLRGADGRSIAADVRVPFTTMSGTTELDRMRRALDDGSAYAAAGIGPKAASFRQPNPGDATTPVTTPVTTVFPPTAAETIMRNDQKTTDPKVLTSSQVPNLVLNGVGCYAFGSIESPQFARDDSTITPTPSTRTPPVVGKARIGFALIVPAGAPPAGGWPVAVYGPGFTRSYFDLFVTSDFNAAAGIATIATDPLGHGFGPASTITVSAPPGATFLSYGRGRDLNGDGTIEAAEGSQPATTGAGEPSPNQVHGLRGGLEQTVVDNLALLRTLRAGVSVPGCPAGAVGATSGAAPLSTDASRYYGLSFGGIYGTMLAGTDPLISRALLNVGGGPIVDIARLSGFRPLLGATLRQSEPSLANGGPGRDGFTESWPLPHDPPITNPAPGAIAIQRYLSYAAWYGRPGGPEPYAPLLRKAPRAAPKEVLIQVAFGDNTVPNLTSGNIVRAGDLFDRVTYYRNDRTPTSGTNPHGFLADPTLAGRVPAEAQLTAFLATGTVVDPDGPGPVFQTPIANPDNLQCLHYPHPQTGQGAFPPAAAGECPARPADQALAPADPLPADPLPGTGGDDRTGSGTGGRNGTASRGLAATGAPVGLPLLGLLLLGYAAVLGRRSSRSRRA